LWIAEDGTVRDSAPLPAIGPGTREIDARRLECQFARASIDRRKPDAGAQPPIAGDDETIAARLERQPMRIFSGRPSPDATAAAWSQ